MFFKKKEPKINDNYIDIKNLPILILDSDWLTFYSKNKQNTELKELETQLRELMKQQGKFNDDIKKLVTNKKAILARMLADSNKVAEKGSVSAKAELDKSRNNVDKINTAINDLEKQSDEIPDLIEKTNNQLFQASVKIAYNSMSKNMKEVRKYEENIDKLRTQLNEEIAKKEKLEATFQDSKDFLNDYIGKDGLKQLDEKYGGTI